MRKRILQLVVVGCILILLQGCTAMTVGDAKWLSVGMKRTLHITDPKTGFEVHYTSGIDENALEKGIRIGQGLAKTGALKP